MRHWNFFLLLGYLLASAPLKTAAYPAQDFGTVTTYITDNGSWALISSSNAQITVTYSIYSKFDGTLQYTSPPIFIDPDGTLDTGALTEYLTVVVDDVTVLSPTVTSSTSVTATTSTPFTYQITATNSPGTYSADGLPEGLTLDQNSGLISGTTTRIGVYNVTVRATNSGGTGTGLLVLTVADTIGTPQITSALYEEGLIGVFFTYTTWATNGPTSYGASNLPPGLSIDRDSGIIEGTPTATGSYYVTLTATNATGTGTAILQINIYQTIIPPKITSTLTANANIGTAFHYQITATGSPSSYAASVLPVGLNVAPATGLITGTPTAVGTYYVALAATNAGGVGRAILKLTVSDGTTTEAPAITSNGRATAQVGEVFGYQITATNAPTSYQATGLPPGLTINADTGLVAGTPETLGTFTVVVGATNGSGMGTGTLALSVVTALPLIPVVTSEPTAMGTLTSMLNYQITATNNPSSFSVTGLPPGLLLNPDTGLVTGTPITVGTYSVTIGATNTTGTGTGTALLVVFDTQATNNDSFNSAQLLAGTAGTVTGSNVNATKEPGEPVHAEDNGGASVWYTWTATADGPVTIDTLNSTFDTLLAIYTGTDVANLTEVDSSDDYSSYGSLSRVDYVAIAGTTYRIAVDGFNGDSGTIALNWIQTPTDTFSPAVTSSLVISGTVGTAVSYQAAATNGPIRYSADGLPDGLNIDATSGLISGIPTAAGTFQAALRVRNSAAMVSATLALNIQPALPTVTLTAASPIITAGTGETGKFVLNLSEAQDHDIVINYTIKGNAINGTDYVLLKTSKKINAGKTSKPIKIAPKGDLEGASKKAVILRLAPGDGYSIGTTGKVKVKILADD